MTASSYVSCTYDSPVGLLTLAAADDGLKGLWIEGQKYFAGTLDAPLEEGIGSEFRQVVWQLLCAIPQGEVRTYGQLAQEAAKKLGRERMSAQATGGAVGHNPISIIIPCHRVVGSDGSLTGYAGGLDKKRALLEHEGVLTA